MKKKTYFNITAFVFLIVGLVHLSKILFGFSIEILNMQYPLWLSWFEMIVAFYLSFIGFKFKKRKNG